MFNLPETYEMIAQMPFGSVEQVAGEKNISMQMFTKRLSMRDFS